MAQVLLDVQRTGISMDRSAPHAATTFARYDTAKKVGGPVPGTECGQYGERLVVSVVDELARKTPERVWATVTRSPFDIAEGFRDITISQCANAVNCAAWAIRERVGHSKDFDTIAYLGVSDVRYAIYLYGAIKTGHQVGNLTVPKP